MTFNITKLSVLLGIFCCLLAGPLLSGEKKGSKEDWMKQAIEKEVKRAKESAKYNGDSKHIEKKYGHLKESQPKEFEAMMQARKNAAATWEEVATKISKAKSYEEIQSHKLSAYDAQDIAELAHLEMKTAESISYWKRSAEKSESKEVAGMLEQLIKKQENLLKATMQKMLAEKERRTLEIERRMLEMKMREKVNEERQAKHEKKKKK